MRLLSVHLVAKSVATFSVDLEIQKWELTIRFLLNSELDFGMEVVQFLEDDIFFVFFYK